MKKLFCAIIAAAMLLLCACGNTETELQLQEENQIENTAAPAPQEEETEEETAAPLPAEETEEAAAEEETKNIKSYVLNERSYKIHEPSCYSVEIMAEHNKNYVEADLQDLIDMGYDRCGNCYPN